MNRDWIPDRAVLLTVGVGLIAILLAATLGVVVPREGEPIPNWAENVLVALVTGALLKLGDLIAAVVALATNRQVERLGNQLGQSTPLTERPQPVTVTNTTDEPVPVEPRP